MSRKALPAAVRGVDRLLGRLEARPFRPDGADDILQVADRAGEPVNARHHQFVAGTQEVVDGAQLGWWATRPRPQLSRDWGVTDATPC